MKEQKNIENIFKEAFEDFELDPGKDAWQKVQSGLNSGLASSAATSSWAVTAIVALVISGVAIGGYYFFNKKGEAKLEASFEKNILETESNELKNSIQETESVDPNSNENKLNQIPSSVITETNETESKPIETPTISKSKELNNEKSNIKQSDLEEDVSNESTNFVKQEAATDKESEKSNSITNESSSPNTKSDAEAPEKSIVETDDTKKSNESKGDNLIESNPPIQPLSFAEDTINIYIPNALTPNSDGKNDLLEITKELSKGLEYVGNIHVTIFNNTGKTVAEWYGIDGSWNGVLQNGSLAPPGSYVYLCKYAVNGEVQKPKKGRFTILY